MLLQNTQLRNTFLATKLPANSEAVKASPQTRHSHSRHEAQARELPKFLPTQPVRLQEPKTKKWSRPGEVLSRAETSHSYVVETPNGVTRRNSIHIKEARYSHNPHAIYKSTCTSQNN